MFAIIFACAALLAPPSDLPHRASPTFLQKSSARVILLAPFEGNPANGSATASMRSGFERVADYMAAHHIGRRAGSFPTASNLRFDEEEGILRGEVGFEVESLSAPLPADGIRIERTPTGRLIRFATHAPFGALNPDYEDFIGWMVDHKIHPRSHAWEVYIRQDDGLQAKDRLTYVYYVVK
ncbi:MAG: hypothetical protein QOE79_2798 [Sphingomonadales bacterium]|jgi:effector-binding domain-containing protein|nr:hypothetical protein [Sphingomonadales bacterium]MEA3048402.1 hypothetical protein [Sphingomonadales bacterium]